MANQYTSKKAKNAAKSKAAPLPKNPIENLPPSFTLLATDNLATMVISYWLKLAEFKGVSASKIASARKQLAEIEEHRRLNPLNCKTPD